jgi:hypothetical protein
MAGILSLVLGLVLSTSIILSIYKMTSKHSWLKIGFIFGIIWGLLSIIPYLISLWDTPIIVFNTISLPLGIAMHIVQVLSLKAYLLAITIGGLIGGLIGFLIGILIEALK